MEPIRERIKRLSVGLTDVRVDELLEFMTYAQLMLVERIIDSSYRRGYQDCTKRVIDLLNKKDS